MVLVNACGRLIKEPQNNSAPLPFHFHQLFRSQLLLFLYVNIWNIAELLRNLNLVDQILTCDKNMIACLCICTHIVKWSCRHCWAASAHTVPG